MGEAHLQTCSAPHAGPAFGGTPNTRAIAATGPQVRHTCTNLSFGPEPAMLGCALSLEYPHLADHFAKCCSFSKAPVPTSRAPLCSPEWQVLFVATSQSEPLEFETQFSWDGGTDGSHTLLITLPPHLHWSSFQGVALQELACRAGEPLQPLSASGGRLIWQWRPEGHLAASGGGVFEVTVAVHRTGGCMVGRQPIATGAARALLQVRRCKLHSSDRCCMAAVPKLDAVEVF